MTEAEDIGRRREVGMIREAIGGAEVAIEIIEEFFSGDGNPPWPNDEVAFHHIHDHLSWAVHELTVQLKARDWDG